MAAPPTPEWAKAFPEPRTIPPKITHQVLVDILNTQTAGVDYVVVDVRRVDIEVRADLETAPGTKILTIKPRVILTGAHQRRYQRARTDVLPDSSDAAAHLIQDPQGNLPLPELARSWAAVRRVVRRRVARGRLVSGACPGRRHEDVAGALCCGQGQDHPRPRSGPNRLSPPFHHV